MALDIVIISHFGDSYSETDNDRFLYLAKTLCPEHQVEIVTSRFMHTSKTHRSTAAEWPFRITFLDEPGYPCNVCLQRFASHRTWGNNVKRYLETRKKPDVIYCAVPSLTGPLAAARYCEKNDVRFVIDVQDLWPEAFQMVFSAPVLSGLVFYPFKALADGIYKRADAVCAVSRTYVQRALSVNRKCSEGTTVFLGTNLETFDGNAKNNPVTDKPPGELWLGYCGTLGRSYDLTCVLDALAILRDRGETPPRFIVMGDGPLKETFEAYARTKELDVLFTGRLPYDKMCGMLCGCDITVNPITKAAAASIINKHADYAASGLPVLNTQECPEYRDMVDEYRMGFNCGSSDADDLAEKLQILMKDGALRAEMGGNARRCAEERFDRRNTYSHLVDVITGTT